MILNELRSMVLKMKDFWYALKVSARCQGSLQEAIPRLGIGASCYAPMRVSLRRRSDRPGLKRSEVLVFSNYLLVRVDLTPEHHQKIIALHGCYGFVQFGDALPVAIPPTQIANLKAELESFSKGLTVLASDEQERLLRIIVREHSPEARNAGFQMFMQLIQRSAKRHSLASLDKAGKKTVMF